MKKLLTIIAIIFPFLAFTQVSYYDSLYVNKLISKVERDRLVYGYIVTSIDGKAPVSHTHGTDDIISGIFVPARLGTGTADSNKYLAGDQRWRIFPSFLSINGTDTSHWNLAYSWGNHATAGYLLSSLAASTYAPISHAHAASNITSGLISTARLGTGTANSTKYLAGDQSWQSFPSFLSINGTDTSHWNLAYSWGNHATAGYLLSSLAASTYAPISHAHAASDITSGTLSDSRIASASNWNGKLDTLNSGSVYLLNDFNTSNTTATSTNLKFAIGANQTYTVSIWGHVSKATTTSGLKLAIDAPAGSTITGTEFRGGSSYTTALTNGEISAINTLGGTFATGAGVKVAFRMDFTITTSGTSGYVTLQGATVTSNTMTIYAGTSMTYHKSRGL